MTTDSIPSFSQVTVSVDDQSWKEVSSFADYGPDAHVYIIAIDPATGAATISFGDGKQGHRPPTGSRIETTYRNGEGSANSVLSFAWRVTDPGLQMASLATITTLPNSFHLSFYQTIKTSWRWRFVSWLCDVLKAML